ncbi:MAG TPA: hypothetical protein VM123_05620 [archaeon]|nr:hypothetical protein [archaeon]
MVCHFRRFNSFTRYGVPPKMSEQQKKKLFKLLLFLYAFAFLMSNGPGVLLVNKPVLAAGIPLLYLWALGWAVIQIGLILYAYFKLWRHELDDQEALSPENGKEAQP